MDEPPSKRPRRTDSAAMWEKTDSKSNRITSSPPHSPRPHASERDVKPRDGNRDTGHGSKRDDDRRRRSRSPRERHGRSGRRSRSRSPNRERQYRERDRDRDRERDRHRVKEEGVGRRDRSKSRDRDNDRHRSGKDRRHDDRSPSPYRNGNSATSSARARSPRRGRDIKSEVRDSKLDLKEIKPTVSATANQRDMDVDEGNDGVDAVIKRMMGFSTFKTTQNTKVPGNQIYGVRKEKKTEYRQYMNRVGGFNRPLSPG